MLISYQDFNFSTARLALIDTANAIITEYQNDGYTLTLRQLYYQFVARGLIENSDRSYKNLGNLISDGRKAGMIPWTAIEDRGRGIRPWLIQEDEADVFDGIQYQFALDYWARQEAYVEVWVEKEALSSVIERPCQRWRVPYMPCKGYLSDSEAWRAGRRFMEQADQGKRCVMIHLGDHDPSGIDMTRDNGERLELFGEQSGVEVRRIALNMDQVEQHRPPPNPAKITDSRAGDYIQRYGPTSWELDALEPTILSGLIEDSLRDLIDWDLWRATQREEKERREVLAAFHSRYDDIRAFIVGTREE